MLTVANLVYFYKLLQSNMLLHRDALSIKMG